MYSKADLVLARIAQCLSVVGLIFFTAAFLLIIYKAGERGDYITGLTALAGLCIIGTILVILISLGAGYIKEIKGE